MSAQRSQAVQHFMNINPSSKLWKPYNHSFNAQGEGLKCGHSRSHAQSFQFFRLFWIIYTILRDLTPKACKSWGVSVSLLPWPSFLACRSPPKARLFCESNVGKCCHNLVRTCRAYTQRKVSLLRVKWRRMLTWAARDYAFLMRLSLSGASAIAVHRKYVTSITQGKRCAFIVMTFK